MTGRAAVEAWIDIEGEYLGVRGVYSLVEMARAICDAQDVCEHLAKYDMVDTSSQESVLAWLEEVGVRSSKVPVSWLDQERWPGDIPILLDEKPGRGYVKVLGVSL